VNEAQIGHVNQLLAAGRFVPMTSLKRPFSADDFNIPTPHVSESSSITAKGARRRS
jgi:hypothetical protein